MSGKTAASVSQLQIPPEVMARYNKANDMADTAASQPFQKYGDDPSAFVAQMNATQTAGQQGITDAQGMYRPYFDAAGSTLNRGEDLGAAAGDMASGWTQGATQYGQKAIADATQTGLGAAAMGQQYRGAATDYTMAGGQAVNPTGLGAAQIGQYMSPFQDSVISSTMGNLRQQQQQEQSAMSGDAIKAGAFGGDRAGIAKANLARQQNLASGQVLSGLNQANYGQALGAAQGQQQVGLGAAQANRAATQQTGQSLAALGQQGYDQGLGTANFQNQMGQTFFNQGTQAASQLNQIGQTGWERASQLSQAQAGLGSGAQAAELAGRQAQMGAGTVQQQTDQAGKQAMYNQFLQQQGYPFQTAQFLANIAMGTGALSGSTTTQTSPAPFFSDKRLKEGAQIIGKTFDGQPIYKFRYKGSPNTHVGLMAQDVEKKHPYSVGLAGGYKTVDYDSATKKAAERGHFADGGLALPRHAYAGGGDADSMQSLLELHKAMYPYGSEGAGRTGGGTGPHGMALSPLGSYKLAQPAKIDAPKNTNTLHDAVTMGDDVSKVVDAGEKVYDKATGTDPDGWKKDEDHYLDKGDSSGPEFYRGGLARARMGTGGMPYSEADNEYVPEDEDKPTHPQLATPGKVDPGHPENALSDAKDIAKIAMMFMNRGGLVPRSHYARGGASGSWGGGADDSWGDDDSDLQDEMGAEEARNRAIDFSMAQEGDWNPSERSKYGINQRAHPEIDDVEKLTPDDARDIYAKKYWGAIDGDELAKKNPKLATAAFDTAVMAGPGTAKHMLANSNGDIGAFLDSREKYLRGLGNYERNKGGWEKRNTALRALASPAAGGLAPTMPAATQVDAPQIDSLTSIPEPDGLGAAAMSTEDQHNPATLGSKSATDAAVPSSSSKGTWFDKHRDWLIPLLKGVGTMAASPSRYLAGAALQGVGAGAGAYMKQQQAEADLQKTQASTQQTQAQTQGSQIDNTRKSLQTVMGAQMVWLADGTLMRLDRYNALKAAGKAAPLLGGSPPDAKQRVMDYIKTSGGHLPGDENGPPVSGVDANPAASVPGAVPGGNGGVPSGDQGGAGPGAGGPSASGASPSRIGDFGKPAPLAPVPGVVYDDSSRAAAKRDGDLMYTPGNERENVLKTTDAYRNQVFAGARAARQSEPLLNEMSARMAHAYSKPGGIDVPGSYKDARAGLVGVANTISRALGGNGSLSDLDTDDQIINKLQTVLASTQAAAGNQEAYAALAAIRDNIPNLSQNPKAGAELISQLLTLNQRQIDREGHLTQYDRDSNGFSGRAAQDFDRQDTIRRYADDQRALAQLMRTAPSQFEQMMSGTVTTKHMREFLTKYGYPEDVVRFFHPRSENG